MAESWAGGLERGLLKGLQIGSMFEEGKARKEAREKRGRDETRAEAKAERDALLTQIKAAGNVLKVGGLPDEIYFENMDIIFSNTSKLMGVEYPGMDSYNKALEEEAVKLDKLRAQYQAGKINRSTYFKGALAISKNVLTDPIKKEPFEKGLKAADEERGILLRQEARAWLEDLQKPEGEQHKIKELIAKGHKNPQWGGRLAEEVDKLKKERRTALLPGTGYRTTETGVRVMDTKEGRMALIGRKQVLYDESIHGQLLETPLTIAQRKSEWAEMRAEELRGENRWSEREITGKVLTELNQKFPSKTGTEVTVNLGTSTKTKIEQDIIEGDFKIESFNEIEKLFKDDYLTYKGQTQAAYEKYAEKLGIPVDTDYLANRTQWKQEAMTTFLAWRKWVTGVAGGEKEMREIAKSFPDPQRNSPTEFRANLKQARKTTIKLRNRLIMFRSIGIENPTKEQLSKYPIEHVPDVLAGDEGDSRGSGVTVDINTADGFLEKYGGGR